jgi:hypothetical protein
MGVAYHGSESFHGVVAHLEPFSSWFVCQDMLHIATIYFTAVVFSTTHFGPVKHIVAVPAKAARGKPNTKSLLPIRSGTSTLPEVTRSDGSSQAGFPLLWFTFSTHKWSMKDNVPIGK